MPKKRENPRYIYQDKLGKVVKTNLTHVTWEDKVTEVRIGHRPQKVQCFKADLQWCRRSLHIDHSTTLELSGAGQIVFSLKC